MPAHWRREDCAAVDAVARKPPHGAVTDYASIPPASETNCLQLCVICASAPTTSKRHEPVTQFFPQAFHSVTFLYEAWRP